MSDTAIDLSGNKVVIEKSNFTTGTRQGYYQKLTQLTIFLFERSAYQDLIQTHYLQQLKEADLKDKNEPRYRKRKQCYLRLEVFNLLRGMKRNRSETCPIRLQSTDGSQRVLTYDNIVSFMETFKKQEKVNKKLAIAFQKAVLELSTEDDGDVEDSIDINNTMARDGEIIVSLRQEHSTYDSIRSAIAQLYTATATIMLESMKLVIGLY